MKDTRFTELINLYIDRQITAAEAAELEEEIRDNPERRRAYIEYCKLHRATKLVYDSFRAHASPVDTAPRGFATIEKFEHRQRGRRYRWLYAVGGAAAAVACLSVVSLRYAASNATAESPALQTAALAPTVTVAADRLPPMGRTQPADEAARPNLLSLHNSFALEVDLQTWLASLRAEPRAIATEPAAGQPTRIEPLFDDQVFAGKDLLPLQQPRVYRPHNSPVPQAPREFTAFQFQR
jgi:hypothetical protein